MNLFIYFLRAIFITVIINIECAAATVTTAVCTSPSRPNKWTQFIISKTCLGAEWLLYDIGITALGVIPKEARRQMSNIIEQGTNTQRDIFEDLVPTLLLEEDDQQANVFYCLPWRQSHSAAMSVP